MLCDHYNFQTSGRVGGAATIFLRHEIKNKVNLLESLNLVGYESSA